jgi:hypothetical protein
MTATLVSDMPRNCSATPSLGLSGTGLPGGGVEADRRAVFSPLSGIGGGGSRLRLGDGWNAESVAGGMLRCKLRDYMGAVM